MPWTLLLSIRIKMNWCAVIGWTAARLVTSETGVQIKLSQTNVLKQTETWDQQHGGSRCEPVSQISFIIVLPARDINFGNIYIPPDYLILFQLSEQNTEQ